MMTKEEYEKNEIRMFDSIRTEHKGENGCLGVDCNDCPMRKIVCGTGQILPFETIEIVENLAKEHPIVTADTFAELKEKAVLEARSRGWEEEYCWSEVEE